MHPPRQWKIAPAHAEAAELANRLGTSPIVAQLLLNRGLRDLGECNEFLRPSFKSLLSPWTMPNLAVAAERLAEAIRRRQKVVIYGDYDVDGITGTAILWHAIRHFGGEVEYYIPHRIEEGYGLNCEAIEQICGRGTGLIVSVDCGITGVEPAAVARRCGVDLVITDHHDWDGTEAEGGQPHLPECLAIVHPRLPGAAAPYSNPHLSGAGVAYKVAWGLGLKLGGGSDKVEDGYRQFMLDATALAGLGTIADVVPLIGENRVLAHYGLAKLQESRLGGLKALIKSLGLSERKLKSYEAAFKLAPHLNACGRMGHAVEAVQLLTDADEAESERIAMNLQQLNRQRQEIERQTLREAVAVVEEKGYVKRGDRVLVVAGENWHAGVIGIVAQRLVERFHRPVVMVAMSEEVGQGSGRSVAGFHLAEALRVCRRYLESCGGHAAAAGLRVRASLVDEFREALCAEARQRLPEERMVPVLELECEAELSQLSVPVVVDLERLGPFGNGNRQPLLCLRGLEVVWARAVGNGDHLQLMVRQGTGGLAAKCIAFRYGPMANRLVPGTRIDLAVEPGLSEWNGQVRMELSVRDVHFG